MYRIRELAGLFGLSRSTLLYYDRIGLLSPSARSESGYRLYSAADRERFANARAEWWWGLRSRFESGDIDIDGDEELVEQLANIKYKVNSRGQILIESKDDMKKRGRKSPDRGDALMLAFAKIPLIVPPTVYVMQDDYAI